MADDTLPLFIDADQLHAAMDRPDVQIVAVDPPNAYARAHIPGALQIDMPDFTASQPPLAGLLPNEDALADVFSDVGLRNDAHIVAYDRAGDGQAARLLYTLDVMGHGAISLLDGGLSAWQAAGHDMETGEAQAGASRFRVQRQPERIADREWIQAHLEDDDTRFLDVRSAPEYAGVDVRSARGGHIPGAISLDWLLFKNANGRLKSRAELLEVLTSHGVRDDCDITAYCQSHVRSSYAYLVLKYLGYERVRGYPGAWSDWGNAENTPVQTPHDNA